jgi:hypothetical protein
LQLTDVKKTFDILRLIFVIWKYFRQTNHNIKITLRDLVLSMNFCFEIWPLIRHFAFLNILQFILTRFVVLVHLSQFEVNFVLQRFHFKRFVQKMYSTQMWNQFNEITCCVLNGISLTGKIFLTRILKIGKSRLAFS